MRKKIRAGTIAAFIPAVLLFGSIFECGLLSAQQVLEAEPAPQAQQQSANGDQQETVPFDAPQETGQATNDDEPAFPEDLKTRAPQTIEELKLLEQHVQTLIEKVRPATVSVAGGSGVVVSEDGYILTVAHVGQRAGRRVRVTFPDGRRVSGITLGNNGSLDAGMIKITSEGEWPYVDVGVSDECQRGQWCLAFGFPVSYSGGDEPPVRLGRILSKNSRTLVSDCTIMGGDSGGPLFDLDGRVIGISSRVGGSLNSNIHVPVDVYTADWDRYVDGEDWNQNRTPFGNSDPDRGYMGVQSDGSDDSARISAVTEGSGAANAGILAGDVVVEFDGRKVGSFQELGRLVSEKKKDETVKVMIDRDGNLVEFSVTLGGR